MVQICLVFINQDARYPLGVLVLVPSITRDLVNIQIQIHLFPDGQIQITNTTNFSLSNTNTNTVCQIQIIQNSKR